MLQQLLIISIFQKIIWQQRIRFEIGRKPFSEMRWEEMWDASLRIQNMFLRTDIPNHLRETMSQAVIREIGDIPVVIRSSAPGEDSSTSSFAGIHESFVNIIGINSILDHIKLVWASLWSDAALLYRREIGLDPERSSMAVVIQELIVGRASGVAFTINPSDSSTAIVESVHGLNQGLVDGTIEPDRWIVDRHSGDILSHYSPERISYIDILSGIGVGKRSLKTDKAPDAPISENELREVLQLAYDIEKKAGMPQDIEWTYQDDQLFLLQARPVTSLSTDNSNNKRSWYLSLRRSFENLKNLGNTIEKILIPEMIKVADSLAAIDIGSLSDHELEKEVKKREEIHAHWIDVYWSEFIPFAHAVRLFGQIYNRTVQPNDPYEFVDLLSDNGMISVQRNNELEIIASFISNGSGLTKRLRQEGLATSDKKLKSLINDFLDKYGGLNCSETVSRECSEAQKRVLHTVLELSTRKRTGNERKHSYTHELKSRFLNHFKGDDKKNAETLLGLARTSYRLRDDDNIYIARIEAQKLEAVNELTHRNPNFKSSGRESLSFVNRSDLLNQTDIKPKTPESLKASPQGFKLQARQLIGQPASKGIANGLSRVILNVEDLAGFRQGEILVCDAVDPTMTYIVPLASGIVERRGGMLIHGAIIAREYGIPCVTGVTDATKMINTGNRITVDGYLGIVTIHTSYNHDKKKK